MDRVERFALPLFVAFLAMFPWLVVSTTGWGTVPKWVDNFGVLILIYIMLGWGLNIVVGLAGLLDLGYVAFYAIGSYTYALLNQHFGFSFWLALPVAGVMAAMWESCSAFRFSGSGGDYLAIVTLAFGEIIYLVALNWRDLTGGAGMSASRIDFFGIPFNATDKGFAATFGLEPSPAYRTLPLLRDPGAGADHGLGNAPAEAPADRPRLGGAARGRDRLPRRRHEHDQHQAHRLRDRRDVRRLRRRLLRCGQAFITPESFVFLESALILAIVVLGGMGSLIGGVVIAALLLGGSELLRELES